MIFSVFDPYTKMYDYFEAPGTSVDYGARGTRYRPLNGNPSGPPSTGLAGGGGIGLIGFAPEALGMPLPGGARQIGKGYDARGVIAVRGGPRGMSAGGGDGVDGLGGLGDASAAAASGISLGEVVFAGCVASVVGVLVQKLLK